MADADMHVTPLGDSALVLHLGERPDEATWRRVQAVARSLVRLIDEGRIPGARECVPAFTTITLYYDPLRATFEQVRAGLTILSDEMQHAEPQPARIATIPVCYGGEFGGDLQRVAEHAGLTPAEVVELHAGALYRVHMLGFAPGFPYLGGLPPRIATPRRAMPRLEVPAGSVGIGGEQTGIYPLATPGGWQIIGRTPRALFLPGQDPPTLLQAGDSVRFEPISSEQFADWREGQP